MKKMILIKNVMINVKNVLKQEMIQITTVMYVMTIITLFITEEKIVIQNLKNVIDVI